MAIASLGYLLTFGMAYRRQPAIATNLLFGNTKSGHSVLKYCSIPQMLVAVRVPSRILTAFAGSVDPLGEGGRNGPSL